jgi:hypothetical protein
MKTLAFQYITTRPVICLLFCVCFAFAPAQAQGGHPATKNYIETVAGNTDFALAR